MGTRRKLGIAFLAGLFLVGVGSGVAFAEFSSFKLGEERVIGAESMGTNTVREKITKTPGPIVVYMNNVDRSKVTVETDASLGIDEIEFVMEYSEKGAECYCSLGLENEFYINFNYSDYYILNYMDDVLSSIRNKEIPNYHWEYAGKQVIRVAPENESRIVCYY